MIKVSWLDVETRVDVLVGSGYSRKQIALCTYVYGVPRGGIPIAVMFSQKASLRLVESLDNLSKDEVLIVDDVIDSGRTRARYKGYAFLALWDKHFEPADWIEFPWERMNKERPIGDACARLLEYVGKLPDEGLINAMIQDLELIKEERECNMI